jgi:hypothetical protein
MNKAIYLDMDGTIANLYGVPDWLPMLRANNPEPYAIALPMVDMQALSDFLFRAKSKGYIIGIISWLSMKSTKAYDRQVRNAKAKWITDNFTVRFDEIHMVKYGTPKHTLAKVRKGILIDDNDEICSAWENYGGTAINARASNWLDELRLLIE